MLAFSRIHTASLTIPVLIISALLSGYSYPYIIGFAVFALLFHGVGFALNNIADYDYDVQDPYKKHFPLITGKINYRNATMSDTIGLIIVAVYGMVLSHGVVSVVLLSLAIIFGIVYNFRNKTSKYAQIYISLSFSLLIPYVMFGRDDTIVMILYTVFAFFTMMYQIGVSGYIKDVEVPQYNMMSAMGMKLIGGQIMFSQKNRTYAAILRIIVIISGAVVIYFGKNAIVYLIPFAMVQILTVIHGNKLVTTQRWIRNVMLKRMSMVEILNYMSIAVGLGAYYGPWWVIFLIVFPMVWFVSFNRIFYGTSMFPRV